jgi:hypothetical protein
MMIDKIQAEYLDAVGEGKRLPATTNLAGNADYIAAKIRAWNGDIFWAPASKSTEIILRYADEVRSVLGPIPKFDTTTIGKFTRPDGSTIETATIPLEVDDNRVELKPNPSKPGSPLEFAHTDVNGKLVKWTATVDACNKPSLAGGVTPCGAGSAFLAPSKGLLSG